MRARLLRHRTLGLMGGCALLAAACSLFRAPMPPDHASTPREPAPAQLVQLDFGREAMFARCVPPACPARTPKTLAPEVLHSPENRTSVIAPANSVAPGLSAPSAAPETPTTRKVTVQFALGRSVLSSTARSQLNQATTDIASARTITIIGRTDSTGPSAFNESLAFARALAVRDHLLTKYPTLSAALTLKAQGACCFVARNDTLAGRAQNRRVEVVLRMDDEVRP